MAEEEDKVIQSAVVEITIDVSTAEGRKQLQEFQKVLGKVDAKSLDRDIKDLSKSFSSMGQKLGASFGQMYNEYKKAKGGIEDVKKSVHGLSSEITKLTGFAAINLGIADGVSIFKEYAKAIQTMSVSLGVYGNSITRVEAGISNLSKTIGVTRKEVAGLYEQFNASLIIPNLKTTESIAKAMGKQFGANTEAIRKWGSEVAKVSALYPELEDLIQRAGEGDKEASRELRKRADQMKILNGLEKTSYEALIKMSDTGIKMTEKEKARNKALLDYGKKLEEVNRVWNEVALTIGEAVEPIIKQVGDILKSWEGPIKTVLGVVKTMVPILMPAILGLLALKGIKFGLAAVFGGVSAIKGGIGAVASGIGAYKSGGLKGVASSIISGSGDEKGFLSGHKTIRGGTPVYVVNAGEMGLGSSLDPSSIGRGKGKVRGGSAARDTAIRARAARIRGTRPKFFSKAGMKGAGSKLGKGAGKGLIMAAVSIGASYASEYFDEKRSAQESAGNKNTADLLRLTSGVTKLTGAAASIIGMQATGAAIGSIIPGVGTAIGGAIGTVAGVAMEYKTIISGVGDIAKSTTNFIGRGLTSLRKKIFGESAGDVEERKAEEARKAEEEAAKKREEQQVTINKRMNALREALGGKRINYDEMEDTERAAAMQADEQLIKMHKAYLEQYVASTKNAMAIRVEAAQLYGDKLNATTAKEYQEALRQQVETNAAMLQVKEAAYKIEEKSAIERAQKKAKAEGRGDLTSEQARQEAMFDDQGFKNATNNIRDARTELQKGKNALATSAKDFADQQKKNLDVLLQQKNVVVEINRLQTENAAQFGKALSSSVVLGMQKEQYQNIAESQDEISEQLKNQEAVRVGILEAARKNAIENNKDVKTEIEKAKKGTTYRDSMNTSRGLLKNLGDLNKEVFATMTLQLDNLRQQAEIQGKLTSAIKSNLEAMTEFAAMSGKAMDASKAKFDEYLANQRKSIDLDEEMAKEAERASKLDGKAMSDAFKKLEVEKARLKIEQENISPAEKAAKLKTEEEKIMSQEVSLEQMKKQLLATQNEKQGDANRKRIEANKFIKSLNDAEFATENKRLALRTRAIDQMISLSNNFITGVSAGIELYAKQIEVVGEQRVQNEKEVQGLIDKLNKARIAGDMIAEKDALNQINEKKQEGVDLLIKQTELSKAMRDGWVSAIQAQTMGSGRIMKLKMDQDQNLRQALKNMGAVVSGRSGSTTGGFTSAGQIMANSNKIGDISAGGQSGAPYKYGGPAGEMANGIFLSVEKIQKNGAETLANIVGKRFDEIFNIVIPKFQSAIYGSGNKAALGAAQEKGQSGQVENAKGLKVTTPSPAINNGGVDAGGADIGGDRQNSAARSNMITINISVKGGIEEVKKAVAQAFNSSQIQSIIG